MPFVIDVDPVAFSLGPLAIRWYGITLAVAIAVAYAIANREAARLRLQPGIVSDGALWVGIAALVGGRLLFVAQNGLADLAAHPAHILMVWMGGLSFYGGLAAGLIALVVFARRRGVPWRIAVDVAAPAAAIGQAIGHIGCLIGGDSAGIATDVPWAVVYRNPAAMAQLGVPLHPTQAYEAIALAALFVVLWAVRRRLTPMPGALAAVYLGGLASHQVPALLPAGRGSGAARAQDGPVDRRRHPRRSRLDPVHLRAPGPCSAHAILATGGLSRMTAHTNQSSTRAARRRRPRWLLPGIVAAVLAIALVVGGFLLGDRLCSTCSRWGPCC